MFTRKKREGFTIVELVIVIAVIGILTAVLVPTFVNLSENAKNASDETLVRNLNTALSIKRVDEGKNETMYDAYLDAKSAGYDLDVIRANRAGRTLVWDQEADEFLTIDDSGNPQIKSANYTKSFTGTMHYWKVAEAPVENSQYSLYIKGDDYVEDIVANYGIDVGRNALIQQVTFQHASGSALDVKVRTYSKDCLFTVNGLSGEKGDTVHHYAYAKSATINSVGSHSYHEHGIITGNVYLENGRVVIESEAKASALVIDAEASAISSGTVVVSADTSKNASVPIVVSEEVKAAIEAQESSAISSSAQGIIEIDDSTVLAVDNVCYDDFSTAMANLNANSTVRLFKDVEYSVRAIEIRKPTIIDLNGKKLNLSSDYGFVLFDNLTIKDSVGTGKYVNESGLCVYTISGAFTGENAYIEATNSYGLYLNGGTINLIGGSLKGESFALTIFNSGIVNISEGTKIYGHITTNGELADNTRTINIYDAEVHGTIYKPDGGTLNIYDGVFQGDEDCALYIKGGTTNISGGTFEGTKQSGSWRHEDDGWISNGNGVLIEGCDYPSGAPFVKITGGTFIGSTQFDEGEHKCYGILAITFQGHAPVMTGTTVPYQAASVSSSEDETFLEDDGEMYFTDSNTVLVNP